MPTEHAIDAGKAPSVPRAARAGRAEIDWTARRAARSSAFWLLSLATCASQFAGTGLTTHQTALLAENGLDPMTVAGAIGLYGLHLDRLDDDLGRSWWSGCRPGWCWGWSRRAWPAAASWRSTPATPGRCWRTSRRTGSSAGREMRSTRRSGPTTSGGGPSVRSGGCRGRSWSGPGRSAGSSARRGTTWPATTARSCGCSRPISLAGALAATTAAPPRDRVTAAS